MNELFLLLDEELSDSLSTNAPAVEIVLFDKDLNEKIFKKVSVQEDLLNQKIF